MAITFLEARKMLAQYADRGGLCPDDDRVADFVKEVLQYILFKGPSAALRTFQFQARQGCITLPYELETPLKVRVNDHGGSVWSMWFRYYDAKDLPERCWPAERALYEVAGSFPTVYDLPSGGAQVGVVASETEAEDAHVIVKGVDPSGREVFSECDGETISGVRLHIRRGKLVISTVTFGRIDHVVKTRTNGYVQLMGAKPATNSRHFLADYSPFEEVPSYRRFRLHVPCAENAVVEVLGRIRLKENYADSDPIPIENILALRTAAQRVQASSNRDYQGAQINDQEVEGLLLQESNYKKVTPGQPVDMFYPTSPGSIKNIVSRGWFRRR